MATNIYSGFFLFSLMLIYFAYRQYAKTQDLLLMGKQTSATVINLISSTDSDGTTYKPVFEYLDNGQRKTYTSPISSSPAPYEIGEKVKVVFDSYDGEVKVIGFWGLYRASVILLMIASPIFVLCGSYLMYVRAAI